MKTKKFGKTGKEVYVLGLGTYGHGEAYGGIGKKQSLEVIRKVINKIPNESFFLIDTAPRYGCGEVEKWLGEFIEKSENKNILIASKGGRHIEPNRVNEKDFSLDFLKKDLEESLKRLNVDKMFLYQLHNPKLEIIKGGKVFDLLESFRNENKIDWYGISIDNPEEGIAAINYCKENKLEGFASIQLIYNVLQKNSFDSLFKLAREHNIAIIVREPLCRGFLSGKYLEDMDFDKKSPAVKKQITLYGKKQIFSRIYELKKILKEYKIKSMTQFAIKFTLLNPNIDLVLSGINRIEYIEEDLSSFNLEFDSKILSEINKISDLEKC